MILVPASYRSSTSSMCAAVCHSHTIFPDGSTSIKQSSVIRLREICGASRSLLQTSNVLPLDLRSMSWCRNRMLSVYFQTTRSSCVISITPSAPAAPTTDFADRTWASRLPLASGRAYCSSEPGSGADHFLATFPLTSMAYACPSGGAENEVAGLHARFRDG